ncbi:50S ribosomal protein L18 [archaeon]|jgi:large subunit ribosomal protein L18|nr:50S ribosomal protein L18 [archaeon]MDD2477591.1 50S ribosomal protein L18 [Candidatus ainarchaeum sp.]MDD3084314.1 50S ribosomal protein L18 [Candidatus ainarchaeum sp.]MDD4221055.1 50S ribosomal protein L18 [Candidatus ainarchaeum sp.]MDD4662527.1 50S ribosomal protein L18 [Candidatus ainarchaeum sp.]
MKSGPTYNVQFRRKRTQKTDYKKRLSSLKSEKNRFVVRLSNKLVRAQVVDYKTQGDVCLASVNSNDLKKIYSWKYSLNTTPAIYLTALMLCDKAKKIGIDEVIFDTGLKTYKPKSKIYAALKAIADSNLKCAYDKKAFPLDERIEGKHIDSHLKNNITKDFNEIKSKILKN